MLYQPQKSKQEQFQKVEAQYSKPNIQPQYIEPLQLDMSAIDVLEPSIRETEVLQLSSIEISKPLSSSEMNQQKYPSSPQFKLPEFNLPPWPPVQQLPQQQVNLLDFKVDSDFSNIPSLPQLQPEINQFQPQNVYSVPQWQEPVRQQLPEQYPQFQAQSEKIYQLPLPQQQNQNLYSFQQQIYHPPVPAQQNLIQEPVRFSQPAHQMQNQYQYPQYQLQQPQGQILNYPQINISQPQVRPSSPIQNLPQVQNQQVYQPQQMNEEQQLAEAIRLSTIEAKNQQLIQQQKPVIQQPVQVVKSEEMQLAEAIRLSTIEAQQQQNRVQAVQAVLPAQQLQQMTEEQQLAEAIRLSTIESSQKVIQAPQLIQQPPQILQKENEYDQFVEKQKQAYELAQKNRPITLSMVANIIEDYFAAPKDPVLGQQYEQNLQQSMIEINKKFMMNQQKVPIQNKVKDLLKVEPKIEPAEQNQVKPEEGQKVVALQVREIDGKQYLVHEVKINDTLTMLSLKYNVNVNLLKQVNNLIGDQIFQKKELLVPVVAGMTVVIAPAESEDSKAKREQDRRMTAMKMLCEHICEVNKVPSNTDFRAEATFYLSENEFDYRKAANSYDADWKFEQESKKKKKKK